MTLAQRLVSLFTLGAATLSALALAPSAQGFEGLVITELPAGGDVTVPGDYPIRVPSRTEVLLTGLSSPQSMTLTNQTSDIATVHIFAKHEKNVRQIKLQPGTSAVYSLKLERPVRIKVNGGDVRVNSILPLKVQR
jgi:hypothetical protein